MSPELKTDDVYNDMRDILANGSHNINADRFKRADIIRLLIDLKYIHEELYSRYDIARTVSAALKKARYTGLICIVLDDDCRWHNEYCFVSASAAALRVKSAKKVKTMKNENPVSSYHYKMGVLKREARALYDNILCVEAEIASVKTLKDYSTRELLDEIEVRLAVKK